jgi:hypothetical protein
MKEFSRRPSDRLLGPKATQGGQPLREKQRYSKTLPWETITQAQSVFHEAFLKQEGFMVFTW